MGITLEKLLPALRQIGVNYLNNQKGMFRNNQEAAEELKKLLLRESNGKIVHEEPLQALLLFQLSYIFKKMKSSVVLLTHIKDKLLEYEPFKQLALNLPEKAPTPLEMAQALESLGGLIKATYDFKVSVATLTPENKSDEAKLKL